MSFEPFPTIRRGGSGGEEERPGRSSRVSAMEQRTKQRERGLEGGGKGERKEEKSRGE